MNLQFQTPWLLYLIWVIPALAALWVALLRRSHQALDIFVSPAMRQKLRPASQLSRSYWQIALAALGSLLLLLAAAGPRWGEREERVMHLSRDLVIAIDVSFSMLANDVHPSRLERAKADAIDLIASLKGDRAAIIAFRNKAMLVCPLTSDHAFLRQALAGLSPDSAPRGETDIGAGILRALNAFGDKESSHKAIILISDGEDLSGEALEAATTAGSRGIPIYTIGIGSRRGSTIPVPGRPGEVLRFEGEPVVTRLDDESLLTIARQSGGSYIPIETAGTAVTTLGSLYQDHLRHINRRELAESRRRRAVERYQWFLFPAFLLLTAACTFSRGRLATAAAVLALLIAPADAGESRAARSGADTAQETANRQPLTGHRAAREAQRLYRQREYEKAAALYRSAAAGSPRETEQTLRYNEATALAAAGRYRDAATVLRALTLQSRRGELDPSPALGMVLGRAAAGEDDSTPDGAEAKVNTQRQAAEAFKEAWRNTPDAHAQHNLALILKTLPAAEENAKALRLAEQYKDTPPHVMAADMLKTQRAITDAITLAANHPLPARIAAFEDLARQQKENAARWMPLRQKLADALQPQAAGGDDQTQAAIRSLYALMDVTRDHMNESHHRLRDIEADGFRPAKMAEQGTYQLWKNVAPHEMLLGESMDQQDDAIEQVSGRHPPDPVMTTADLQRESAELTDLFRARFEQAIPPEGTVPPPGNARAEDEAGTMPEGITPAVRQRILELAEQAAGLQREAADRIARGETDPVIPVQKAARDKLDDIAELLPKPPSEPQPLPPDDQQENPQEPQPPPDEQPDDQPDDQQSTQPPENQTEPEQTPAKPETDEDVQNILRRALEREREHEEEKRRRQRQIPLPPSTRDW